MVEILEASMNIAYVLLIIVIVLLLVGLPVWPHAAVLGPWPNGAGVLLLIVVLLLLVGR